MSVRRGGTTENCEAQWYNARRFERASFPRTEKNGAEKSAYGARRTARSNEQTDRRRWPNSAGWGLIDGDMGWVRFSVSRPNPLF